MISFWEDLDEDLIRFVVLLYKNTVVDNFRYPAQYWGASSFVTNAEVRVSGISADEITEPSWSKNFATRIKDAINSDASNINVPGIKILVSMVDSVVPLDSGRTLRVGRRVRDEDLKVSLTIAGQYTTPPRRDDFANLIDDSINRLLQPGRVNSIFGDSLGPGVTVKPISGDNTNNTGGGTGFGGDDNWIGGGGGTGIGGGGIGLIDDDYNDDDTTIRTVDQSSNVGIILGVIFGLLAFLIIIIVGGMVYYKRQKKNTNTLIVSDDMNTYDPSLGPSLGYTDIYGQTIAQESKYDGDSYGEQDDPYDENESYNDSYKESYKESVITDPTFRGGKYPQSHKYSEIPADGDRYDEPYGDYMTNDGTSYGNTRSMSRDNWSSNDRTYDDYEVENHRVANQADEEEDYEEDEVGTFTGLSLKQSALDDVSCLMSVRGVEDTWNQNPANISKPIKEIDLPSDRQSDDDDVASRESSMKDSLISAPTVMLESQKNQKINNGLGLRQIGRSMVSLGQESNGVETWTSAPTVMLDRQPQSSNDQVSVHSSEGYGGDAASNARDTRSLGSLGVVKEEPEDMNKTLQDGTPLPEMGLVSIHDSNIDSVRSGEMNTTNSTTSQNNLDSEQMISNNRGERYDNADEEQVDLIELDDQVPSQNNLVEGNNIEESWLALTNQGLVDTTSNEEPVVARSDVASNHSSDIVPYNKQGERNQQMTVRAQSISNVSNVTDGRTVLTID